MSIQTLPTTTAGIYPELFSDDSFLSRRRSVLIALLLVLMLAGLGLRTWNLGAESLSEDELNKLQTVADYRANGLSGRNGEHPFLMKGLQTVSVSVVERINQTVEPASQISEETALRLPTAIFGTLTILALYLLVSELFGATIGLIAAALWAVDPTAVGFDRIAKEDSFLLFFFLLANVFWIRGQSRAERTTDEKWVWYLWGAAICFGAMIASKYLPHLLGISASYYIIFQAIPATRWRFGKMRWLMFFIVMGISFLIFNPTILLPDTWREMLTFSGEKRIGHDSNEFMGALYRNQMTAWLAGVPWTFYYVFIAVKLPLLTLFFFLLGLPLMFRRRLGDGRYFIFFWALLWFMPFSLMGGKFTRYFTVAEPLILISAAVGFHFALQWISRKLLQTGVNAALVPVFQTILFAALAGSSLWLSISATPHFRLYTNALGGGMPQAGYYFPHDEFYDASTREILAEITERARPNAVIANETPGLFEHYARRTGREDLVFVSLSDKTKIESLTAGDFIVAARGRRYFSNRAYLAYLDEFAAPVAEIKAGEVTSAKLYQLDDTALAQIKALAK